MPNRRGRVSLGGEAQEGWAEHCLGEDGLGGLAKKGLGLGREPWD